MTLKFSDDVVARLARNGQNDPEKDRQAVVVVRSANKEIHFYLTALLSAAGEPVYFGLADFGFAAPEPSPGAIRHSDMLAVAERGEGWELEVTENDKFDPRTIGEIARDAADGLRRDAPPHHGASEKIEDPARHRIVDIIGASTIRDLLIRGFEGAPIESAPYVHLHDKGHRIHFYIVKSTLGEGFHGLVDLNTGEPRIGTFDYEHLIEAEAIGPDYQLVCEHEGDFRNKPLPQILEERLAYYAHLARTDSCDPG